LSSSPMTLGVSFPRLVFIENSRLWWLEKVLQVIVTGVVVYISIQDRMWFTEHVPLGKVSMWASVASLEAVGVSGNREMRQEGWCDPWRLKGYDYVYSDYWKYLNHTCLQLRDHHLATKESESTLFIPTYMRDDRFQMKWVPKLNGTSNCTDECSALSVCPIAFLASVAPIMESEDRCHCQCKSRTHHLIPAVEEVAIGFEHSSRAPTDLSGDTLQSLTSGKDILTILRFGESKDVLKRVSPGPMSLQVSELLEFLQVSLDDEITSTVANQLSGSSYMAFPAMRITGASIVLEFQYHNKDNYWHLIDSWDGPLCIVKMTMQEAWTSRTEVDEEVNTRENNTYRVKHFDGIRIRTTSSGSFSYLNPLAFHVFLTTLLVFMKFPNHILLFIVRNFMGALSRFYEKALEQRLSIHGLFGGAMTRAVVAQQAYAAMLTHQQVVSRKEETHLRIATLGDKVGRLYASTLQDEDAHALQLLYEKMMDQDGSQHITEQEFLQQSADLELCDVHAISEVFSATKKTGIGETLFDANRGIRRRMMADAFSYGKHAVSSSDISLRELLKTNPLTSMDKRMREVEHGLSQLQRRGGEQGPLLEPVKLQAPTGEVGEVRQLSAGSRERTVGVSPVAQKEGHVKYVMNRLDDWLNEDVSHTHI